MKFTCKKTMQVDSNTSLSPEESPFRGNTSVPFIFTFLASHLHALVIAEMAFVLIQIGKL